MIALIRTVLLTVALTLGPAWHQPGFGAEEEREGGLVGTGTGLGLLGIVTDLGSIWVNGLRVTYPPTLRVETAFGSESPDRLAVGDTVQVEAHRAGDVWRASSIQRYQPLISTVQHIGPDGRTLVILQTVVHLPPGVGLPGGLRAGDWVEVSGLWRERHLIASKVTRVAPRPDHAVRGILTIGADGAMRVGGVAVEGLRDPALRTGQTLAVRGRVVRMRDGNRLLATRHAVKTFSFRTRTALIEGYLSDADREGRYTVYGSGVVAQAGEAFAEMPGWRGVHCAFRNRSGAIEIRPLARIPEGEAPRRATLGPGSGGGLRYSLSLCR